MLKKTRTARWLKGCPLARFERLEDRTLLAGDLVAQWQANDLLTEVGDGAQVRQWTDSVASIEAAAFGTPSLAAAAMGGRPAIRFDSTDVKDGFRVSKERNPISAAADFSVAVYFSTTNVEPGDPTDWFHGVGLVHSDQKGFNRDWGIAIHGGQVGAGIGRGLFQPSTSVFSTQTTLNDGQPHLAVFTRQADVLTLHVDDADPVTVGGASVDRRDTLELIFGVTNLSTGAWEGDLAEARFYDGALNTEEVAQLRGSDCLLREFPTGCPRRLLRRRRGYDLVRRQR